LLTVVVVTDRRTESIKVWVNPTEDFGKEAARLRNAVKAVVETSFMVEEELLLLFVVIVILIKKLVLRIFFLLYLRCHHDA
jgi:hypothetical protein